MLHPQPLLRWFGTYWPALIILWGVIKLVEYQQAKKEGTRPAGIGAGGVLLLIFLIVFGMSATSGFPPQLGRDTRPHQIWATKISRCSDTPTPTTTRCNRTFPAGGSLRIVNDRGAVNLTVSDDNQIHVAAHKRINADSQEEADKFNPATKPQISVSGNVDHPERQYAGRRRPLGHDRSWMSASRAKRRS